MEHTSVKIHSDELSRMQSLADEAGLTYSGVVQLGLDAIAHVRRENPELFVILLERCRQECRRRDRRLANRFGRPAIAS